jgi:hypothetical protein
MIVIKKLLTLLLKKKFLKKMKIRGLKFNHKKLHFTINQACVNYFIYTEFGINWSLKPQNFIQNTLQRSIYRVNFTLNPLNPSLNSIYLSLIFIL